MTNTFDIPKPKKLPEPIQAVHLFVGGPLNGEKHQATVMYDLTNVILTLKGTHQYRYTGNDTFKYMGETKSKEQPPADWLYRAKMKFFTWLIK